MVRNTAWRSSVLQRQIQRARQNAPDLNSIKKYNDVQGKTLAITHAVYAIVPHGAGTPSAHFFRYTTEIQRCKNHAHAFCYDQL